MAAVLAPDTAPAVSVVASVEPGLEARLAAAEAGMDVLLERANMAMDAHTAHLPDVDWVDHITGPVTMPTAPVDLYPTPVAALLQRARQRLTDGEWCRGDAVDGQGAMCLQWAIHTEARGDTGLEVAGLNALLDQIRADLDPGAESVPSWNDRQTDARMPLRILDRAANTAAGRGN